VAVESHGNAACTAVDDLLAHDDVTVRSGRDRGLVGHGHDLAALAEQREAIRHPRRQATADGRIDFVEQERSPESATRLLRTSSGACIRTSSSTTVAQIVARIVARIGARIGAQIGAQIGTQVGAGSGAAQREEAPRHFAA